MFDQSQHLQSPLARQFSHFFLVALAALLTSGAGLLSYAGRAEGPSWLRATVLLSALLAAVSLTGWVVCNFAAYARRQDATPTKTGPMDRSR